MEWDYVREDRVGMGGLGWRQLGFSHFLFFFSVLGLFPPSQFCNVSYHVYPLFSIVCLLIFSCFLFSISKGRREAIVLISHIYIYIYLFPLPFIAGYHWEWRSFFFSLFPHPVFVLSPIIKLLP